MPRALSRASLFAVGSLCALLAISSRAGAQDDDDGRARALFAEGVAAADAGRWEDARARFEATYALLPLPQVLLNLAGAQAQTGRLTSAAESYRRVIESGDDAPDTLRDAARLALGALEPRIPRLVLRLRGAVLEDDRVRLDETVLPPDELEGERPLDPGRHSLVLERGGDELVRQDFRLYEGERLRLDLRVPAPPPPPTEVPPPEVPEGDEWWESPVFWAIVGIVVAGGIAIGIAVSIGSEEPFVGNLDPGAIGVR